MQTLIKRFKAFVKCLEYNVQLLCEEFYEDDFILEVK